MTSGEGIAKRKERDMSKKSSTRRQFIQGSAAALAASQLPISRAAFAAGDDVLKVSLIGCGGRGTGAASQALRADKKVKLVAMADAFADRLKKSLDDLQGDKEIAAKIDVPAERQFVGFDAYKQAIEQSDVVLLCTPPHFRPAHLEAAIKANRHVFAEKPVAVDAPGVNKVLQTCDEAKKRNLSVVSGLCLRYSTPYNEMMHRIHNGDIGDVVTVQANDLRGRIWMFPRKKEWTDMEWQMRNWYYFTWLSGDFNVEQHVHNLDVATWAMGNRYPVKATGMGGRQVRVGAEFGNIYDHFAIVYEYENGAKLFANTRQQVGCKSDICVYATGTQGNASISELSRRMRITGKKPWRQTGKGNNFYQTEHDELFASIRKGKPINNGEYMAKSTLLAIMGRMAAYTGQEITWEMAMKSKEDLTPAKYAWGPVPMPEVALPGVTRFK